MMKYDRKYISDEAVERYDDARFAMLMEGYAAWLGEKYVEENLRLQEDDSFAVPAELDEKCLKAIDAAIARKQRRENLKKAKRVAKRLTVVAASFLVVIAISSVVLFNTVEAFRLNVVDYVIELFDIGEGSLVSVEPNEDNKRGLVYPTWLPDGYIVERDRRDADLIMMYFSNGENLIAYSAHSDVSTGSAIIDTENAIETYGVTIADNNGVVVRKEQDLALYWFEADTAYYIWTDSTELDTIIRMAESCYS